jgi:hypothetical protein
MSRDEALTATWNVARALCATLDLARQSGTPYVSVPVHLLLALRGAVESVEAVGAATAPVPPYGHQEAICGAPGSKTDVGTASSPEGRTEGLARAAQYWCLEPDCFEVLPAPNTYCPRHQIGPDTGRCSVEYCWRAPTTPGGVCYFHSPQAHAPQVRRRDRVFEEAD